jgi:hypothetical protein
MAKEVTNRMVGCCCDDLRDAGYDSHGADPATILVVLTVVIGLIRKCREDPVEGVRLVRRRTGLQRFRLRNIIRRNTPDSDRETRRAIERCLCDMAGMVKDDEMSSMYAELDQE